MTTRSKRSANPAATQESEKPKRSKTKEKERVIDSSIIDDVKCPVCQEISKEVTTTPCGHNFCLECIAKAREKLNFCAVCREFLGNWKPRVNITLRSIIAKQDVQCPYEECNIYIKLREYEFHKEGCSYRPSICDRCQQKYITSERDKHDLRCPRVPCPSSNRGCSFKNTLVEVNKHVSDCPYEKNSFIIDLLHNAIKSAVDKLETDLVSRVSALNDRIDALAFEIEELGQNIAPDEHHQQEILDEEEIDEDELDDDEIGEHEGVYNLGGGDDEELEEEDEDEEEEDGSDDDGF